MCYRTEYIRMIISTVPTEWYHLVFNYISGSPASGEGIIIGHNGVEVGRSTQKVSLINNAGSGVVVIGRHLVQLEKDFASVMMDELLFFNRYPHRRSPDSVQYAQVILAGAYNIKCLPRLNYVCKRKSDIIILAIFMPPKINSHL